MEKTNIEIFSEEIDKLIIKYGLSHFDAIIEYCDIHKLEVETIAPLVKANIELKSKITLNAEDLRLIPKTVSRLPI